MQTRNALGFLTSKYRAVLKKCRILNAISAGALAGAMVVGSGSVADANDINISGIGAIDQDVSLKAGGGSPSENDKVTTTAGSSGSFNLNIDGRDVPLYTMIIGNQSLGDDLTVTLQKGGENETEITSYNLSVVADTSVVDRKTIYNISKGLTHTVNGGVSIQGDDGVALLEVADGGTLVLNTSAGGNAGTIKRGSGDVAKAQLNVSGTLKATDGTQATDLKINEVNLTLNGAYIDTAALTLDATNSGLHSTLTLTGENTITGDLNTADTTLIDATFTDANSALKVADTLTLTDVANDGITLTQTTGVIKTASLAAVQSDGTTPASVTLNSLKSLDFTGGGTIGANINTASGEVIIDYSDSALASDAAENTTTLSPDVSLNINSAAGLNVRSGATLDASDGNLTVINGGFYDASGITQQRPNPAEMDIFSDAFTYNPAGEDGLGVLIVDSTDIGFTTGAQFTASREVKDNFFGDLVVEFAGTTPTMTYDEYQNYLLATNGATNSLIQGVNSTLKFVDATGSLIEITGVPITLDQLVGGTSLSNQQVNVGTGIVQSGTIEVGSVYGNQFSDITLNKADTTLKLTGGALDTTGTLGNLFEDAGAGVIDAQDGALYLGGYSTEVGGVTTYGQSTLTADINLGNTANGTAADLYIIGDVDMSKNALNGFTATEGQNTVVLAAQGNQSDLVFEVGTLNADNTVIVVQDDAVSGTAAKMVVSDGGSSDVDIRVEGAEATFEAVNNSDDVLDELTVNNVSLQNGGQLNVTGTDAVHATNFNSIEMYVEGEIITTDGIVNITGGDSFGNLNGARANLHVGAANLGVVNIASGVDSDPSAGGQAGSAALYVENNSATAATINLAKNPGGYVSANLNVGSTASNGAGTSLTVTNLNTANGGTINVNDKFLSDNIDTVLTVTGTYTESSDTQVSLLGSNDNEAILDVSATTFGEADADGDAYLIQANYNLGGGVLVTDALTVDSANLQNKFFFTSDRGTINATDSITFTDANPITLNEANMNLVTETLNSKADVTLANNAELIFVGGGMINTNLTTAQTSKITIDRGTTKLAADKTIDIDVADSLNVVQGNILDVTAGTLKVAAGGYADGPGALATAGSMADGIGTIIVQASGLGFTSSDPNSLVQDANTNIKDDFWGTYQVVGLNGSMTYDQYEAYLVDGTNRLIQGNNATLNLGANVTFTGLENETLDTLVKGTHVNQAINIGTGDVNQGGTIEVGAIIQDSTVPKDVVIQNGTTLKITGQGGNTELFQGNEEAQKDIVIEYGTAVFGSTGVDATLNADIVLFDTTISTHAIFNGNVDMKSQNISQEFPGNNIVTIQNGAKVQINNVATKFFNLTENSELTLQSLIIATGKGSVGSLSADGAAVDEGGSLTAETLNLNRAEFTVHSGVVNVDSLIMDAGSNFFTGSNVEGGQATTIIGSVQGDGNWMATDPAWNSDPALNTPNTASLQVLKSFTDNRTPPDTRVNTKVGSFQNGLTSLGTLTGADRAFIDGITDDNRMATEMTRMVAAGLDWGNTADNPDNTTAAIAFYAPMVLNPDNSLIVVDGSVVLGTDASGDTVPYRADGVTPYNPAYNTANFAANSLTIVDANAFDDSAVLSATNGELVINKDADLVIMGGHDGQSLTVATGFTDFTLVEGWGEYPEEETANGQLSFDSRLMAANDDNYDNNWDSATGQFVVEMKATTATDVYDRMQGGVGAMFDNVASQGLDVYSKNAGISYISALDSQTFNPDMTDEQVARAIESSVQLGALGATNKIALEASEKLSTAVGDRVSILKEGAANGDLYPAYSAGDASNNSWDIWLTPFYQWGSADSRSAGYFQSGYDLSLGGAAFGGDVKINQNFTVGLGVSLGTGDLDSTGDLTVTNNDADFQGVAAYAAWRESNWGLAADIGYTAVDNDIRQRGVVPGFGDLTASPDSDTFTAGLRGEYLYETENVDIMPHVGLRYTNVKTDGYHTMNAAGTLFATEADTQNVWTLPVGVTFSKDIETDGGWNVTPSLDLGFIVAAGDLEAASRTNIASTNISTGEMLMENVDNFVFNGGLGFDATNANGVAMSFDYNIQASGKETAHAIVGTVGWSF